MTSLTTDSASWARTVCPLLGALSEPEFHMEKITRIRQSARHLCRSVRISCTCSLSLWFSLFLPSAYGIAWLVPSILTKKNETKIKQGEELGFRGEAKFLFYWKMAKSFNGGTHPLKTCVKLSLCVGGGGCVQSKEIWEGHGQVWSGIAPTVKHWASTSKESDHRVVPNQEPLNPVPGKAFCQVPTVAEYDYRTLSPVLNVSLKPNKYYLWPGFSFFPAIDCFKQC